MIKIRLKRFGRIHKPFYRIVVIKARTKRQGSPIEEIGYIDPIKKERKINKERAEYWLSVGAQPSETVMRYFVSEKIVKEDKKDKKTYSIEPGEQAKQRKSKKEEKKTEKKEAVKEEKVEETKEEVAEAPTEDAKSE